MATDEGVFGVGASKSVEALQSENILLRALLAESKKKEQHATASFNAAKLANVYLSNRMNKLEAELTEFAEELANANANDGATPAPNTSGGGGEGDTPDDVDQPSTSHAQNDGDGGGAAEEEALEAAVTTAEVRVAEVEARLSKTEAELASTRRALMIVVEAFGRDAVVDRLQASANGDHGHHHHHHHDHTSHQNGGTHVHGHHRHHRHQRASPSGAGTIPSAATHRPTTSPPAHKATTRVRKHGRHRNRHSPGVIMPSFIRQVLQDGLGAVRPAHGSTPRHGQPATPHTSPFATAPGGEASEFQTLHPLAPLSPDPVPVSDFLAEFRAGGTKKSSSPSIQPSRHATQPPAAGASDSALHRQHHTTPGHDDVATNSGGISDGNDGSGGGGGHEKQPPVNGEAQPPSVVDGHGNHGEAAVKQTPTKKRQQSPTAVSSYVQMTSPGSAQTPDKQLVQQVTAEVGSFVATFRRRRGSGGTSPHDRRRGRGRQARGKAGRGRGRGASHSPTGVRTPTSPNVSRA